MKRAVHAVDLARDLDGVARRELIAQLGDGRIDRVRDAAEVAILDIGVDLVDRLHIRLVRVGRHHRARQCRDIGEQSRDRLALWRQRFADRGVGQRVE